MPHRLSESRNVVNKESKSVGFEAIETAVNKEIEESVNFANESPGS